MFHLLLNWDHSLGQLPIILEIIGKVSYLEPYLYPSERSFSWKRIKYRRIERLRRRDMLESRGGFRSGFRRSWRDCGFQQAFELIAPFANGRVGDVFFQMG